MDDASGPSRFTYLRRNVRLILPSFALGCFILSLIHSLPPQHPAWATAVASLAFVVPAYLIAELLFPFLNGSSSFGSHDSATESSADVSPDGSYMKTISLYLITIFLLRGSLDLKNLGWAALISYIGNIFEAQGSEVQRLWSTFSRFVIATIVYLICPWSIDWIPSLFKNMYLQLLLVAWFDFLHIRLQKPHKNWWQRVMAFGAVVATTVVVMIMLGIYPYFYNYDLLKP